MPQDARGAPPAERDADAALHLHPVNDARQTRGELPVKRLLAAWQRGACRRCRAAGRRARRTGARACAGRSGSRPRRLAEAWRRSTPARPACRGHRGARPTPARGTPCGRTRASRPNGAARTGAPWGFAPPVFSPDRLASNSLDRHEDRRRDVPPRAPGRWNRALANPLLARLYAPAAYPRAGRAGRRPGAAAAAAGAARRPRPRACWPMPSPPAGASASWPTTTATAPPLRGGPARPAPDGRARLDYLVPDRVRRLRAHAGDRAARVHARQRRATCW